MAGIYLKLGTVRSMKSSNLINTAHRYEDKGTGIFCFKSERDTRDIGVIASRNGLSRPCYTLKDTDNLISKVFSEREKMKDIHNKELEILLIDECQLLSLEHCKQILFLSRYFSILLYGLRSDFKANTWEAVSFLENFAKDVEEVKNPCQYCSSLAKLNLRLVNGEPVVTGDSISIDEDLTKSEYIPVCPKCYAEKVFFKDILNNI